MKNLLFVLLAVSLLFSCGKDEISNQGFTPIQEQNIYDSLSPQSNFDYYELRDYACFDSIHFHKISSFGTNPFKDTVKFYSRGVIYAGSTFCTYNVMMTVKGNDVKFLTTLEAMKEFLGTIDNKHKALFIAHLKGYYFRFNDQNNGIKEINGEFQILALKTVRYCLPVQTDRFLLEIDRAGNIKIIKEETFSKEQNACI